MFKLKVLPGGPRKRELCDPCCRMPDKVKVLSAGFAKAAYNHAILTDVCLGRWGEAWQLYEVIRVCRSVCVRLEGFLGVSLRVCVRVFVCVAGIGISSYLGTAVPHHLKHLSHFSARRVWTDATSSHKRERRFATESRCEAALCVYLYISFCDKKFVGFIYVLYIYMFYCIVNAWSYIWCFSTFALSVFKLSYFWLHDILTYWLMVRLLIVIFSRAYLKINTWSIKMRIKVLCQHTFNDFI